MDEAPPHSRADGGSIADAAGPDDDSVAELHHIAGLTAGRTVRLRPGTFRMGTSPSSAPGLTVDTPTSLSFDLLVGEDGSVQIISGQEPVAVEGVMVQGTAHLDDGDVIQLRSDHFELVTVQPQALRRPLEPLSPHSVAAPTPGRWSRWLWLCAALVLIGLVLGFYRPAFFGLCLIGLGGSVAIVSLRRRNRGRAVDEHARVLSNARSLLFNQILDSRKIAARDARADVLTPLEVARRAAAGPGPFGEELRVTLASGDRSWDPPVVCHRDTGWDHQAVIDELSFLPAVPIAVDLDAGPIAIVGERRATLAVARHVATAALATAPRGRGVAVDTLVPSDWRWLDVRAQPVLHILDGVAGPWVSRTVVIASSSESLEDLGDPSLFAAVLDVAGTITTAGSVSGTDVVPHGITETHARSVLSDLGPAGPVIDLRDVEPVVDLSDTTKTDWIDPGISVSTWTNPAEQSLSETLGSDRLFVSGPDNGRNKDVLASAALLHAERHPNRAIFVLDRGDRALIRLAQLRNCRHYVAIDQVTAVESMVSELMAFDGSGGDGVLLLAPDLWNAIAFYRNSNRQDLAEQLTDLLGRVHVVPMAASAREEIETPEAAFLVWIDTASTPMTASSLHDQTTATPRALDRASLPGVDLTGSVAHLISPSHGSRLDEETTT